jgi:hypothetical protein
MKKEPMESKAHRAGTYMASVFAVAALIFLLLLAGCTGKPAAEPVTTAPPATVQTPVITQTAVPTPTTESPDVLADRAFAKAADACYNQTPVITNLSERLTFATCMKDIPRPPGNCAQNYRYYVLKATNEDTSSAGYAREKEINHLAREAFLRGEGYDAIRQEYAPCGNATKIPTSFYK